MTAPGKPPDAARDERHLADFVDTAAIGLHWVGRDGQIVWANKADYEPLGYEASEYIGHNIAEFHVDHDVLKDILKRLAAGERLHEYHARLRCKDGSIKRVRITSSALFDEQGKFVHTRCFTRETGQEEGFKLLISSVKDYAMFILGADGRVENWNPAAARLYGYGDEIIGQPFSKFFTDEAVKAGRPREQLEAAAAKGSLSVEDFRTRKDGTSFWANAVVTALLDHAGRVQGFGVVTRDSSAQRAAEEERERLLSELREAVRARDEFLSIASHELKTPLTSMKLNLEQVERSLSAHPLPGPLAEKLEKVDKQIARLSGLIENLLDVSRVVNGQLQFELSETDLEPIVKEVVSRFAPDAERAQSRLTVKTVSVVGQWDALRLDQVVSNLVSNALKYGGGKPVEVTLERAADGARLTVRDHGLGIPREHHDRIFERFERAVSGRNFGGFGLGLWITRQIVEGLGGTISVSSEAGSGSTFTVNLPLSPSRP